MSLASRHLISAYCVHTSYGPSAPSSRPYSTPGSMRCLALVDRGLITLGRVVCISALGVSLCGELDEREGKRDREKTER